MMLDNQSQQARETWYALREFETRDITGRSFRDRHSRDLSAAKGREIISNFIQAREYFRSASTADFTVRPLLQYYGVASMSRGITHFLDVNSREASLKRGHGIAIKDWTQILSGGLTNVGDLRIKVTDGTFHELLEATENKFYFRSNSSKVNWFIGSKVPELESEFTFGDVVARIPDVKEQYSAWTGECLVRAKLNAVKNDDNNKLTRFTVSTSAEKHIETLFPSDVFPHREVETQADTLTVECTQVGFPFLAQETGGFNIGDVVLCDPLHSRRYFTPLAAAYISSYILGMLCRYFSTTWTDLIRSTKGDSVYPLIIRLLDWIQDKYPAMIVDILRGPYDFETDG